MAGGQVYVIRPCNLCLYSELSPVTFLHGTVSRGSYLLLHVYLVFSFPQLQSIYKTRADAIQRCVSEASGNVRELKARADADPSVRKQLRKEQTKVSSWLLLL